MYRIIDDRSTGKSSRLMLLAKETGAKIACANPENMRKKAYSYGITGIDFVPYSDLFNGKTNSNDLVMIDELECFIHNYVDGRIIGYTLSKDD